MCISIAIDGYSGSGKSTLAKQLAEQLGYIYLDTGALYRAVTLKIISTVGESFTESDLKRVIRSTKIRVDQTPEGNRIFLDRNDVTDAIREPRVANLVSKVAAQPLVRKFLINIQRKSARGKNVVLEGRDIGTVVLPKARFKFFITADLNARAQRRWQELKDKGITVSLDEVKQNLTKRDTDDSSRKIGPLKKADGAIVIDSSAMTADEKLNTVLNIIRRKLDDEKNFMHTFYVYMLYLLCRFLFRIQYVYEDFDAVNQFRGLVVSNHCSNLDPPAVGTGMPFHMHYFAKESLMKSKFAKFVMNPCNLIPVNREQPSAKSIKRIFAYLKQGKSVLVFPEGTRSKNGKIQTPKKGVGLIAARAGVPVLPVWVKGTHAILPSGKSVPRFKKITVVYGVPFSIDMDQFKNQSRKDTYLGISALLLDKIKLLRDKYEKS